MYTPQTELASVRLDARIMKLIDTQAQYDTANDARGGKLKTCRSHVIRSILSNWAREEITSGRHAARAASIKELNSQSVDTLVTDVVNEPKERAARMALAELAEEGLD